MLVILQDSGAFVFGLMSFCDKLAGGTAILIIQLFCPCAYVLLSTSCYRSRHSL